MKKQSSKKKSKRGGARPGSGRKPDPVRGAKIERAIALHNDLWEYIDWHAAFWECSPAVALDRIICSRPVYEWDK